MKNIIVYTPNHVVGMSITLIKELCWVASTYAAELQSTVETSNGIKLVSANGKDVQCFSGNIISMDLGVEQLTQVDALFIGAFWGSPQTLLKESQHILHLLPQLHDKNIPIAAVSNGAYLLAEAGLLNGKVATIYPPAAESFQQQYPLVDLRPERAITDAGNLYCANGIASGCDLTVAIIEMLYGQEVAHRISHDFLMGFNRTYSIANVAFDGQKYHKDQQILSAQQWLERNYTEEINLELVATNVGMSPRNFSRRFKLATGDSPSHYLKRIRIESAKELLLGSSLTIAEIVYRVGYNDLSYFCRLFKNHEGCMPNSYRQKLVR